jgi:hypothetical protein
MSVLSFVRTSDGVLATWLPRIAGFVAGAALGALLAFFVVNVVWPGVIPGFAAPPLTAGAPARATAVLAALCGVAATVFVTAYQSSRRPA